MFGFFKKKKTPIPLFEVLGTDMHCHLIPGVDDGSTSIDESLKCLRMMQQAGYHKLYASPHFNPPRYANVEEDISSRFEELKAAVAADPELNIELLGVGGEYRIDDRFLARLNSRPLLTVGGKDPQGSKDNYLLVELSLHQQMFGIDEIIFDAQSKGYEVILAHPERYPYLVGNSKLLEQLKGRGVLFQVNVLSIAGFYGQPAFEKSMELVQKGWVELLGTDMHNPIYANALLEATLNRNVQKVLEKHTFMNSKF